MPPKNELANCGTCQTGQVRLAQPLRAGELLLAAASMGDERFAQTAIYLLDCDESGCLGVIVNRLSDTELEEVLPQWASMVCAPQALFAGGPVSPNGAVCVARVVHADEDPPGWRRVHDDLGLLHLDTPVELAEGAYSELRIFAGYAGWAAGQLEAELLRGDWHRTSGRPEDVFGADPATLWRRLMRRVGGEAAMTSTWPDDPELN